MASETGQARADLERELVANSREYDFYQVVRLLQRLQEGQEEVVPLRYRPVLGLERSESDVAEMKGDAATGYQIAPTFIEQQQRRNHGPAPSNRRAVGEEKFAMAIHV